MTTSASPTAVILVAAGRGNRMGGGLPKQWRDLAGRPVLAWTAKAFRDAGLARLIVAIHPDDRPRVEALGLPWVTGGATRSETVRNALEALARAPNPPERVLIHDGARPLVPGAVIDAVLRALDSHVAAAPALAVTDALWRGETHVTGVQPRDGLFRAQTPQGFRFDAILAAHRAHPAEAADDVAVARAAGLEVWITQGSEDNLKLTYPVDFERAERLLRERQALKGQTMDIRTGNGFDVHAFTEGDHVWLCGVKVPHTRALLGHSDADVGMHALTDALYGALAEGDIGRHFPLGPAVERRRKPHLPAPRGRTGRRQGFRIAHCDVTLICERPKIGPHAEAMRAALAAILGIAVARVSVKATTSERLGFTGREEGIAALATATLIQE